MDTEQIDLLSTTLRDVLSGPPEGVDARLTDLGWEDVVADDASTATRLLFTEHGRALARTNLLDRLVLDALEVTADAVAYPQAVAGAEGVSGLLLHRPAPGSTVAVPVQGGIAVVPIEALTVTPLAVFDPSLRWFAVSGRTPATSAPVDWPAAVAVAHRALAAELIGAAGEVLRLAVEHTSTRTQFGAPIAAFQAVRHRLADSHVAIAAAQSLLLAAFLEGSPASARAAKAQAGRAHELASANALQVCGAMGSTLEHPLHTFISRGVALDALLGGWAEQTASMGRDILATGTTPLLIEV